MFSAESLIKLVTPLDCIYCGREGSAACLDCCKSQFVPVPSRCYRCRIPTDLSQTCKRCRRNTPLKNLWVAAQFDASTKQLLTAYKFERVRSAAGIIAELMAMRLPALQDDVCVVPVPTATSRIRQRGYDQASLIAKELANKLGLPYQNHLVRLNQTRQVGSSRLERQRQLQGAYRVISRSKLVGRKILLVDDVLTTGATLEQAARCLKDGGAASVAAAVFLQR